MIRWFVTLPPQGGARLVAQQAVTALKATIGDTRVKVLDTRLHLDAFNRLLRTPDENMAPDLMNQALAIQVLDFHATHLLVPALTPVTPFTLNLLRSYGVKTIHWFFEDFRRAHYWKDVIGGYDLWCGIQRGEMQVQCEKLGVRFLFLPTAGTPPPDAGSPPSTRSADVAFVGIPSSYRVSVLEHLHAAGVSLYIGGSGWDQYNGPLKQSIVSTRWIEGDALSRLLLSAKIGINLSVEDPSRDRSEVHLSPRVFDILLHTMVLLSEDVPLFHEIMQGVCTYTFTDADSALRVIREVLGQFNTMGPVLERNRIQVLADHLYTNRMRLLVDHLEDSWQSSSRQDNTCTACRTLDQTTGAIKRGSGKEK